MQHGSSSSLSQGDRVRVRVLLAPTTESRSSQDGVERAGSRTNTLQILTSSDAEEHELSLRLHTPIAVTAYEEWWSARSERRSEYLIRFSSEYTEPAPAEPDVPSTTLARLNLPFGSGSHAGWNVTCWRYHGGLTLSEWRLSRPDESLSDMLWILEGIEEIMRPLHDAGYALLSLRPDQIRITEDSTVVLDHLEDVYALDEPISGNQFRPGYVHPNFFDGRNETQASIEADVHVLAAIAWFLVVGKHPPSTALTSFVPAAPLRAFMPDLPVGVAPVIESALVSCRAAGITRPRELVSRLSAAVSRLDHSSPQEVNEIQIVGESHPGIAKRLATPINQDAIFYDAEGLTAMLLVADGVSTARYGRGDIASNILMHEARRAWTELDDFDIDSEADRRSWIHGIIARANRQLIEEVNEQFAPFDASRPLDVMATTATIALIHEGRVTLASLGDSPAFLVRDGTIERLNRDHNVMTMELADGASPERVASLAWPDALARCMGSYAIASNGRLVPRDPDVDFLEFPLQYGDRVIVCSDGIVDYIGESFFEAEEFLLELMIEESVPALAALEAVLEANRGGGGDNLSILLCYAEEQLEPLILTSEYVVLEED